MNSGRVKFVGGAALALLVGGLLSWGVQHNTALAQASPAAAAATSL
jgi:hypothetical protein